MPAHGAGVDLPAERIQRRHRRRRAPREVRAIQPHGAIVRKEVSRVAQQAQVVAVDLGVGGVDIDHVCRAAGDGAVGERVRHAGDPVRRQIVGATQPLPAVVAIAELVAEGVAQVGMIAQIADGADAEPLRLTRPHRQRVAIRETQRRPDADASAAQRRAQASEAGSDRLPGEDLAAQRAGVLRIHVDVAAPQGAPEHARAAELQTQAHPGAGGADTIRGDVGEDHRLVEGLGADHHARRRRSLRGHAVQQRAEQEQGHGLHAGGGQSTRCARTKRRTNSWPGA
jgi:hypothetical protein